MVIPGGSSTLWQADLSPVLDVRRSQMVDALQLESQVPGGWLLYMYLKQRETIDVVVVVVTAS